MAGQGFPPAQSGQPYQTVSVPSRERPTGAFILALVAGIFILIGGATIASIGSLISSLTLGASGGAIVALGAVGAVMGILVIALGVLLYITPQHHVVFGVLILVLSVLSIFTALGGIFLGLVLGIIAGALGIAWKPGQTVVVMPASAPQPTGRVCLKCGRMVPESTQFCSFCGNKLG